MGELNRVCPFVAGSPNERLAGFVMHQGERYWKREWVIEGIPAIGIPRVNPEHYLPGFEVSIGRLRGGCSSRSYHLIFRRMPG